MNSRFGRLKFVRGKMKVFILKQQEGEKLKHIIKNRMMFFRNCIPYRALDIPTHLTNEEKVALYKWSKTLSKNCVALEVGSYLGASACIIGSAIRPKGGVLHCVDTWKNQAMDEPMRDTWDEFEANTRFLKEVIQPHRGFSADIARSLSVVLDFLFIDGNHSEEAVNSDLELWLPKVRPGGIVAMHDIGWAEGVIKGYTRYLSHRVLNEEKLQNLRISRIR
jgi:predicted O-methyltransferase YrrM